MKNQVNFIGKCKECNTTNEVTVPKEHIEKLIPRYCTDCGNKINYLKKPCSL